MPRDMGTFRVDVESPARPESCRTLSELEEPETGRVGGRRGIDRDCGRAPGAARVRVNR